MAADGGISAREALISATARFLIENDESELRVLDICGETNVSTSVLYAQFQSRQGLVDQALIRLYRGAITEAIALVRSVYGATPTEGGFVPALYHALNNPERQNAVRRVRQIHLRVTAAALARPKLRVSVAELQNVFRERLSSAITHSIERGYLSENLTANQWAIFLEGQLLSQASHDLRHGDTYAEEWLRIAEALQSAPPKIQ